MAPPSFFHFIIHPLPEDCNGFSVFFRGFGRKGINMTEYTPKSPLFRGAATALVTPFKDGAPDFETLGRLIERQIEAGIDALVVTGTTGEAATLSERERRDVVRFSAATVRGRVPLIAGTGSPSTHTAVRLSCEAAAAGADAVLVVTPYYNKPTPRGIVAHYREIARAAEKPVIVYHVPSRTGTHLSPEDYQALAAIPGIAGIKEAGAPIADTARTLSLLGGSLPLYAGNDAETLPYLSLGAEGVVSVVSNLFPREVAELCRLARAGEWEQGRRLFFRLLPFASLLFSESNPIPVKAALSLLGLSTAEVRLPLTEATEMTKRALQRALDKWEEG
jgi:4-hydroxy-tetrahydrodipicolinate synthase